MKTSALFLLAAAAGVLTTAAPVRGAAPVPSAWTNVLIEGVPHVEQKPDFCGEACVEMVLRKRGHAIDQDQVFNASGLDPVLGRGCWTADLKRALERLGFDPGPVWERFAAKETGTALRRAFDAAHRDLARDVPSIVCMRTGDKPGATEHFRLLLGYDADRDEIIYHEPAESDGAYRRMARDRFFALWPLKSQAGAGTVIRLRLELKALSPPPAAEGVDDADYAQHILALKKRLPGPEFTLVLERPFVVIGDEPAARVRLRAENTVRWATGKLKEAYFKKNPEEIIDIWLFKDDASYRDNTWALFRTKPTTPYGYSSSEHHALVMNIGTGGGTLVHEMVHPFMAVNFSACPAWFDEGMGSLYEQSREQDGTIQGLTNWRLAGLQQAIRAGSLPSFEALTGTSTRAFYGEDSGTNYAQARYLLYALQERGLLVKYYHAFVANQTEDPTGYETLKKILETTDMEAFQKTWEEEVLQLRFP